MKGKLQKIMAVAYHVCEIIRKLFKGEFFISESSRTQKEQWDRIIRFSVTSDGTSGKEWILRLEKKGYKLGEYTKNLLLSPSFNPTSGVITKITVLKGILFDDEERTLENFYAKADKWKLEEPSAEVACLMREQFTNEEIEKWGLWQVFVAHNPLNNNCQPGLLGIGRSSDGYRWLYGISSYPKMKHIRDSGFAFADKTSGSQ